MIEHHPHVEICVLGPVLVRVDGVERPIGASRQRLLLLRLLVDADAVVPTDQLVDALWGAHPPQTADKNLHVLVGRLRGVLGSSVIATEPGGYRLDPDACSIDALAFEAACARARAASERDEATAAIAELQAALAPWRGDVRDALDQPWGAATVARLTELRDAARERLLGLQLDHDPESLIIADVEALVDAHPARQSLRALLVRARLQAGDVEGARAAVVDALAFVRHEVGLEPGAELQRLAAQLRVHDFDDELAHDPRVVDDLLREVIEPFTVVDLLSRATRDAVDQAFVLDRVAELVEGGRLVREVRGDSIQFRHATVERGDT